MRKIWFVIFLLLIPALVSGQTSIRLDGFTNDSSVDDADEFIFWNEGASAVRNINWENLRNVVNANINWDAFPNTPGYITAVNWSDGTELNMSGVNWSDFVRQAGYNNSNWDTAYGWGDHGSEGYITGLNWDDIDGTQSDINLSGFTNDAGFITALDAITEGNTSAEVVDTGSDGHFKVTTEGTERLRVLANGNVGIGTSAPSVPLEVIGNAKFLYSVGSTYLGEIKVSNTGATFQILGRYGDNMINYTPGTIPRVNVGISNLMVLYNGLVGIGTTAPAAKLNVLGVTEQQRLSYDASNYMSTTVDSTGAVTLNAVGSGSAFTFSDPVTLSSTLNTHTIPGGTGTIALLTDTVAAATTAANLGADGVDALTEIAQSIKTAANDTSPLVVGTSGSNGEIAKWNTDGTLTDSNIIIGTVIDGKWCSYASTGTLLSCTQDPPAGSGDVTGVGDCASGACLDGTSDGGTWVKLYDGDSNLTQIITGSLSSDNTVTLPTGTGTLVLTTGNVATATALQNNGSNCSSGNSPLGVDASGAVESCFDVLTQAELIDEDNMATDSATRPPSQQSVKAYVDTGLAAQDECSEITNCVSGAITGNQTITLSGDATGSGTTAITVTVANDSHDHTTTISGKSANVSDADFGDVTVSSGAWSLDQVVTTSKMTAATIVTESEGLASSDNDTSLPTTAAVIDYVASNGGGTECSTESCDLNADTTIDGQSIQRAFEPTNDVVYVGNGTAFVAVTIPECNESTEKLIYQQSTNSFTCESDQTGSGGASTGGIVGGYKSLYITNDATNPDTQIDITSAILVLADTVDGSTTVTVSGVAVSCDITTTGKNGREASDSDTTSEDYDVYVGYDETAEEVFCLLNLNGTDIDTYPSTTDYIARVGWITNNCDNDADSGTKNDICRFLQRNNQLWIESSDDADQSNNKVVTGGTSASYTTVSPADEQCPDWATRVHMRVGGGASSLFGVIPLAGEGSPNSQACIWGATPTNGAAYCETMVGSNCQFQYRRYSGSNATDIWITGIELDM